MELRGELDAVSRAAAIAACSSAEELDVLVDLSGVVFMDCAGYGALVAAKSDLERRGGTMALINPLGAPRRLLALLDQLEHGLCAPVGDESLSLSQMPIDPGPGASRLARRETIDYWSAVLARRDVAEVDRIVRQSRIDRGGVSSRLGVAADQPGATASTDRIF